MKKKPNQIIGVLIAWLLIYAFFAINKPQTFLSISNVELLLRQSTMIGIGAVGMTYVIVAGGIDLSAGSVIALSSVVGGLVFNRTQSPWAAVFACALTGVLCGTLNGVLTSKLKAGPFIVTLGSMLAIRGIAKGLADEKTVSTGGEGWLFEFISKTKSWFVFPIGTWMWIFFLGLMAWAMIYTNFGRNVVAVGSNESAAKLCGIAVDRVKTGAYAVAGFFFGLAGLMSLSRTSLGDPTSANGDELRIIAAVVIGGASLSGGEGSVIGAAIGALIMATISMGGTQMGVANWKQEIFTGIIILAAVAIDRWRIARRQTN
jgi:ribose transport system permease protein